MSFLSAMGQEFVERRNRLRASFGDRNASLVEFALFGGVVAGVLAAVLGQWRGVAPLIALLVGYTLLDASRQRALAQGADAGATRKRHDRLTFLLFAAMAAIGIAFLVMAMQPPPHKFGPPPAGVPLNVDLSRP